jgi:uncharacterized membrane protein (UPF0127 family)
MAVSFRAVTASPPAGDYATRMAETEHDNPGAPPPQSSSRLAWGLVAVLVMALLTAVFWPTDRLQTESPDEPAAPATEPVAVNANTGLPTVDITLKGEPYRMEIAASWKARAIGMSGRRAFPAGTGMVFVYPTARPRTLWMRDCLVNMDAVFVDDHGRIAVLHEMVTEPVQQPGEPRTAYQQRLRVYACPDPVRFILELPAGTINRLELKVGESVALPRDDLMARVVN